MPLLFDQNISYRILKAFSADFPGCKQVREVGLEGKTDREIWNWAKENGFAIASFDSDFVDLSILLKSPPKVVWFRLGNSSTNHIAQILLSRKNEILDFLSHEQEGILKIESGF
ncbi:DUF5615 family PIN-like protein [Algoriphagus aestuariicola]|uniref:DUF5615 family PIN-like protein n=1 Tax=Algoriphagus aestuariicola TaxID=1852016 RepID=A0ABS3BUL2_9BACT|nr:DUF5615 family PIN-like protein [Algoriphagus aestuariicola]MBN7802020.1 DUF5615 family PIN-like protein [Algoriphagus aestuariicola]